MPHRNLFRTINFRLALLYAGVFGGSVVLLGLIVFWGMRTALEQQLRQHITTETAQLLIDYREDGLEELRHDIRERRESQATGRLLYYLQGPGGRVIFDDLPALPQPGWHTLSLPVGTGAAAGGRSVLLQTIALADGYLLGIGADRAGITAAETAVRKAFGGAFLVTVLTGLAGGLWLSRRFLSQIGAITAAAASIGRENLALRLPIAGTGDELDHLANVINAMLERIEQLVGEVRQASSGIAHDLRTPLGHVRQTLEAALAAPEHAAPLLARAMTQIDDVLATFAALLRIAEVEHGAQRAGFAPVDLTALLETVTEAYRPAVEDNGQTLTTALQAGVELQGDRALLLQLCANLLDNAVRHAGQGAQITVTLLTGGSRQVTLVVADTGPGVPMAERANLTRPFYRLEQSRTSPGNGLGLSLVAAIARLHGFSLTFADQAPGLQVRLEQRRGSV